MVGLRRLCHGEKRECGKELTGFGRLESDRDGKWCERESIKGKTERLQTVEENGGKTEGIGEMNERLALKGMDVRNDSGSKLRVKEREWRR